MTEFAVKFTKIHENFFLRGAKECNLLVDLEKWQLLSDCEAGSEKKRAGCNGQRFFSHLGSHESSSYFDPFSISGSSIKPCFYVSFLLGSEERNGSGAQDQQELCSKRTKCRAVRDGV